MTQRGFTLLELLITITLAAMLMVAVMNVIAGLSATGRAMNQIQDMNSSPRALESMIQWDIDNSDEIRIDSQRGLIMLGHASIHPTTMEPTHQPVEVCYYVQPVGTGYVLLREQSSLSDPSSVSMLRQMALMHVHSMQTELHLPGEKPVDSPTSDIPTTEVAGVPPFTDNRSGLDMENVTMPAPGVLRLTINWADPQRKPMEMTFLASSNSIHPK